MAFDDYSKLKTTLLTPFNLCSWLFIGHLQRFLHNPSLATVSDPVFALKHILSAMLSLLSLSFKANQDIASTRVNTNQSQLTKNFLSADINPVD